MEELRGIQWRCPDESHPGAQFLHGRLWEFDDPERRGAKAPLSVVVDPPPVDVLDARYPLRMTTGRRLDSFNTGVQTGGYTSPLRRPESLDISPEDGARLKLKDGDLVRAVSRRGEVEVPIRIDTSLRAGLVFMTLHFQDDVATNLLTID